MHRWLILRGRKVCHWCDSSFGSCNEQLRSKANLKRCHGFKFAVKTFRSRSRLNNVKSYTMAQTSRHLFLWMAAKVGWNPLPSSFVVARRYNKWFAINQISRYHSPQRALSSRLLVCPPFRPGADRPKLSLDSFQLSFHFSFVQKFCRCRTMDNFFCVSLVVGENRLKRFLHSI